MAFLNYAVIKLPQATATMITYCSKPQTDNPLCGLQIHFCLILGSYLNGLALVCIDD